MTKNFHRTHPSTDFRHDDSRGLVASDRAKRSAGNTSGRAASQTDKISQAPAKGRKEKKRKSQTYFCAESLQRLPTNSSNDQKLNSNLSSFDGSESGSSTRSFVMRHLPMLRTSPPVYQGRSNRARSEVHEMAMSELRSQVRSEIRALAPSEMRSSKARAHSRSRGRSGHRSRARSHGHSRKYSEKRRVRSAVFPRARQTASSVRQKLYVDLSHVGGDTTDHFEISTRTRCDDEESKESENSIDATTKGTKFSDPTRASSTSFLTAQLFTDDNVHEAKRKISKVNRVSTISGTTTVSDISSSSEVIDSREDRRSSNRPIPNVVQDMIGGPHMGRISIMKRSVGFEPGVDLSSAKGSSNKEFSIPSSSSRKRKGWWFQKLFRKKRKSLPHKRRGRTSRYSTIRRSIGSSASEHSKRRKKGSSYSISHKQESSIRSVTALSRRESMYCRSLIGQGSVRSLAFEVNSLDDSTESVTAETMSEFKKPAIRQSFFKPTPEGAPLHEALFALQFKQRPTGLDWHIYRSFDMEDVMAYYRNYQKVKFHAIKADYGAENVEAPKLINGRIRKFAKDDTITINDRRNIKNLINGIDREYERINAKKLKTLKKEEKVREKLNRKKLLENQKPFLKIKSLQERKMLADPFVTNPMADRYSMKNPDVVKTTGGMFSRITNLQSYGIPGKQGQFVDRRMSIRIDSRRSSSKSWHEDESMSFSKGQLINRGQEEYWRGIRRTVLAPRCGLLTIPINVKTELSE